MPRLPSTRHASSASHVQCEVLIDNIFNYYNFRTTITSEHAKLQNVILIGL